MWSLTIRYRSARLAEVKMRSPQREARGRGARAVRSAAGLICLSCFLISSAMGASFPYPGRCVVYNPRMAVGSCCLRVRGGDAREEEEAIERSSKKLRASQDADGQGPDKERPDVKQGPNPPSKTASVEILSSGASAEAEHPGTQRSAWMMVQGTIKGIQQEIKDTRLEVEGVQAKIESVQQEIRGVQVQIEGVHGEIEDALRQIQDQQNSTKKDGLWTLLNELKDHKKQLVGDEKRLEEDKRRLVDDEKQLILKREKLCNILILQSSPTLAQIPETSRPEGKTLLPKQYISFSTCLGGHEQLGRKLFIRESYLEMMERIAMEFRLDPETLKDEESIQRGHQVILTGTPGIGKSCFAYFLLVQLLRPGEQLVYQIGSEYWYFDGEAWSLIEDQSAARRFIRTFRHWYICDLENQDAGNFVRSQFAKTILISAPKTEMFEDILNRGAQRYLLPLWSDEEMSLFISMHGDRVDLEEAEQIIEEWGNVPRYILVKPIPTLEESVVGVGSMSPPKWKTEAESTSKLIDHPPDLEYKTSLADSAFEFVAREVLKRGGKHIIHRLGDRSAWEELNLERSHYVEFPSRCRDLKELEITPNGYYEPKAPNLPCNALCLSESGVLYMFQMTRAPNHLIKLHPLLDTLKALRDKNKFERVSIVFVVPAGHDEWWTWNQDQDYTSDGVETSKEQESEMRRITQFILTLSKEAAKRIRQ
ncbi:hypothetical protein GUITHDRAFT_115015 [Guillardia theta CCMP2712]|uniref:Uncharacterized protein n=1 Tax=Guillardia theta (strain CCMP2712) TaxID=905079 RepID=L1IS53_GUITC|nr:hypothetical protein GUITHDRAFT_115015 [Guillardia theta CCMP2712]EKX38912.1 hypothetical protein GUITHDRAFT_115015 [Guillardia theta CCMP2712]|eukprot:XP_005825892.1 hypothetical protein GUITHDRAFT_115015 [Guillardia theta CCMP2712]